MKSVPPVKFGKYLLLEKIASGGMAELFRAKLTGAEGFEKLLAIKKILQHLNTEEKLIHSFIAEAKLAASLHHPNIVQIFDFGCIKDTYYIAMEYLFGKDLRHTLKRSFKLKIPMSLDHILFIVSQLLSGLDYAHNHHDLSGKPLHIIHRDIGPQNIFITYTGQVKVIDFGIAKASSHDSNTQIGTIKGKVSYMSPEQANGDTVDHRSDIFSVGIVLYELLTLKKMYGGDTFQVLAKARDAMFKPAESINATLPTGLYAILDKALAKFPEDRYQTAEDMCWDIESLMAELGIRVGPRELSGYMKDLFDEESRETEIGKHPTIRSDEEDPDDEKTLISDELDTTNLDKTRKIMGKYDLKRCMFLGVVFGLTIFIYLFSQSEKGGVVIDRAMDSFIAKRILENLVSYEEDIKAGKLALESGDYNQAIEIFEDILKEQSSNIHRIAEDYSTALTLKASHLMVKDMKSARIYLDTAHGIYPKNSQTCFLLGKVYTKMKKNRKALGFYEMSLENDPINPDTFFNMGYNYAILDDYGKAQDMYKKVIELSPPFLDQAYFNLALIQEKTGKRKAAVENMKKALEINPKNKNARKFLKRLNKSTNK